VNVISRHSGRTTIEVADTELLAINNALNEVCNALDIREFDTRMGCSLELAKALLKAIGEACDRKPDQG
jgi:hypothetical protein